MGTYAAIGNLLVVDRDSLALLAVASAVAAAVGLLLGLLFGLVWPLLAARQPITWIRKHALVAACATLLLIAAFGYGARVGRNVEAPGPRPPLSATSPAPLLFVTIDTLRADTMYGEDLGFANAPRVGKVAGNALVFADAEATAGWTIPSMAAMFTGIHNWTTDASAGFLPSWAPTLATRLRHAGFATHAVVDNALLERRNGFAAGFETFQQRSSFRFVFSLPPFRLIPDRYREILKDRLRVAYHGARGVTDTALEVLATYDEDAPLFLYVHYMDPHAPYYPQPASGPDPPGLEPIEFMRVADGLREGTGEPPSAAQLATLRYRYDGEVRALDPEVGRLLQAWQARYGRASMIVLTSDHGEEFLEHGHLGHSLTVQRELVHVPLVIALPEGSVPQDRAQGRVETPVSLLDLTPTILDVVGVEASWGPPMRGQSWMPWLRGGDPPERPLMATHSRHGRRTFRYRVGDSAMVRTYFYDGRPTETALYDLASDPAEQRDRSAVDKQAAREQTAALVQMSDALVAEREVDAETTHQVDEESLRALGYIR
jgi:arylsulfatase A-like enzyme